ncbi:MAG: glutathione S-transferase [Halieaceae bacterium]|jgi:glutathione S-transferase|nr:hypothetical protein MGP2080_13508 [marine gamma proteobacterium HTCC2080]MBT4855162.1 glutathione S-transferase [Halieaceae bacterium]MBT6265501.1 glutathione S-transferase [Halieaceae bacterium]MBT6333227.1 glutathione S-transferase [Halieaceae bacterium]MBT7339749.1 glutathione S-transferase [Halieaceae bacterium]
MTDREDPWVLHHYEASPYAEKIRLMFGHTRLPWHSVISPPMPPRPNLDPLTGGYRRIPVAQRGADLFCDTALISLEIARETDRAALRPDSVSEDCEPLVAHAQGDVFFSVITSEPPLKILGALLRNFGLRQTYRFFKDRKSMMKDATIRPPSGKRAGAVISTFFSDLDALLADRAFLDGERPGYADFAAIHPVKFKMDLMGTALPRALKNLNRWYEAMLAPGHGERFELQPDAAFRMAAQSEPRPLPPSETHEYLNQQVSAAPTDYGQVPITGSLISVTTERYIIARQTEDFGVLHVHFPRAGYVVKPS